MTAVLGLESAGGRMRKENASTPQLPARRLGLVPTSLNLDYSGDPPPGTPGGGPTPQPRPDPTPTPGGGPNP